MTNRANWGNLPHPDWVKPWEWNSSTSPVTSTGTTQMSGSTPISFNLEDHWQYGGYKESLFASSMPERIKFIDSMISEIVNNVPTMVANNNAIKPTKFLINLARYNGLSLETVRRKLNCSSTSFNDAKNFVKKSGIIFTIGQVPNHDDTETILYYFCDTGILMRLLRSASSRYSEKKKSIERAWEGFVIQILCRGVGTNAAAWAWRRIDDEIDLVLYWKNKGRKWGIEIGYGADKRPTAGFWRSVEHLGCTHKFVIHRGNTEMHTEYERYNLLDFLTKYPL